MQVQDDTTLETDETLLLTLSLNHAAMESGGRIGARNESRLTIINDDSKINPILIVKHFLCYSSGPSQVSTKCCDG